MKINLNNVIVAAMMARPSKFLTDAEMMSVLNNLYGGHTSKAIDAATSLAREFVVQYDGAFAFIRNLKPEAERTGTIPPLKLKGVLNVIRKDAIEQKTGHKTSYSHFAPKGDTLATTIDLGLVAPNVYPFEHDGETLVVGVSRPGPDTKWDGWIFLDGGLTARDYSLLRPQQRPKLGSQRPGQTLKLTIEDDALRDSVLAWATLKGVDIESEEPVTPTKYPTVPTGGSARASKPKGSKPAKVGDLVSKAPKAKKPQPPAMDDKKTPPTSIRDKVRARYHLSE